MGAFHGAPRTMNYAILRTQKLKSGTAVRRSLLHAFREQPTPNADIEHTADNTHIGAASSAEALDRFNARLATVGTVRKNAVLAIEYLVTASPEAMHGKTREQQDAYFRDTLDWLKAKHGTENVLYAGVHRDESTPHLYAYVVPIDARGKLNCRAFLGGAGALREMQTDFSARVGERHGLRRGVEKSRAKHQTVRAFYGRLAQLEADDPALQPMKPEPWPLRPAGEGLLGRVPPARQAAYEAELERVKRQRAKAEVHNRKRQQLLVQLAARGLTAAKYRDERAHLVDQAKAAEMKATQADKLAADMQWAGRAARDRARELEAELAEAERRNDTLRNNAQAQLAELAADRDKQLGLARELARELAEHAPQRAREIGLIRPEPKPAPPAELGYESTSPGM